MKGNIFKRLTREDKFGRKFYCKNARLNLIKFQKRYNRRKFRRIGKVDDHDN